MAQQEENVPYARTGHSGPARAAENGREIRSRPGRRIEKNVYETIKKYKENTEHLYFFIALTYILL